MVRILRSYGNIIIVLLNLYSSENNAMKEIDWVNFWTNLNFRRTMAQYMSNSVISTTFRPITMSRPPEKPIPRAQTELKNLDSYYKMLEANSNSRLPTYYFKIGHPNYGPILKSRNGDQFLDAAYKNTEINEEITRNRGVANNNGKGHGRNNYKPRISKGHNEHHTHKLTNQRVRAHRKQFKEGVVEDKIPTNEDRNQKDQNQNKDENRDKNPNQGRNKNNGGNQNQNDNQKQLLRRGDNVEVSRIPKLQPEPVVGKVLYPHKHLRQQPHLTTLQRRTTTTESEFGSTAMDELRSTQIALQEDGNDGETKSSLKFLNPYGLHDQLQNIMKEFTKANVTIEKLGHTAEYKDILIMKITERKDDDGYFRSKDKYIDEAPEKKIIFIVHGLSVTGINSLKCLHEAEEFKLLLSFYLKHLRQFDIFLIPIANPDGYSAVLGSPLYRYWNKNMSPQDACHGVVLDRNFGVAWNISRNVSSCSLQFPGRDAFTEVESKVVRDIFHIYGLKIIAYIHVHGGTYDPSSFKGDAILYPKGFTDFDPDDDKYIDLKGEVEEAMKNASFRVMSVTVENLCSWYGKTGGSSVDFASTVYGIPFAMEFVMQPYDDTQDISGAPPTSFIALVEIWGRLIKTTFNYFHKTEQMRLNELGHTGDPK